MKLIMSLLLALGMVASSALAADKNFSLQVNDKATGEAMANVDVSVRTEGGAQKFTTNDQGQVSFSVTDKTQYLNITAKLDKYVPMSVSWQNINNSGSTKVPENYTLNLEPGTTIGGIIQDEQGQPISGATVMILVPGDDSSIERPAIWDLPVKTNDKGEWRCDIVPAKLDDVWLRLSHPDYASDDMYGATQKPPMEKLRDRTGVMMMKKGSALTGKVTDLNGVPIAGAQVMQGRDRWGSNYPSTKTDKDGIFKFKNAKANEVILTVQAKGFAPDVKEINGVGPIEFKLAPGKLLKGRLVDTNGKGIPGVRVVADTWRGYRAIQFSTNTDKDGNFVWKDAPEDEVQFDILKRGYGDLRNQKLKAGEETISLTMRPPTKVTGTVVDAVSGAPIAGFRVIQGFQFNDDRAPRWQRGRENVEGKDGKFSYEIGYPYPFHVVRIEAEGYSPAISRAFKSDQGAVDLEFKLEKGQMITGILHTADGKPAPGEKILQVVGSYGVAIQNGKFQSFMREGQSATTDEAGKFSFPMEPQAFLLIAVTDQGIARLDVPAASAATRPTSFEMTLQAWGTVQGTIKSGTKPVAHADMTVYSQEMYQPDAPRMSVQSEGTSDEQGHFVLKHVAPGNNNVARMIKQERSTGFSSTTSVEVKAGQTAAVDVGGNGRSVIGKVEIPADLKSEAYATAVMLRTKGEYPKPNIPPDIAKASPDVQAKWYKQYSQTPEGKAFIEQMQKFQQKMRHYPIMLDKDGKFFMPEVAGGEYVLDAYVQKLSADPRPGPPTIIARATRDVMVPDGVSDEALDVGVVTVTKEAATAPAK